MKRAKNHLKAYGPVDKNYSQTVAKLEFFLLPDA
jgi:hypothetical protein